jgi:cyclohexanone monooxygenase
MPVVDHLTVFQRTANYSVPSRNRPMDPRVEREWKRTYDAHRRAARASKAGLEFEKPLPGGSALEVSEEERERVFEDAWTGVYGAFSFLSCYTDILSSTEANELAAEFVRRKIRETVHDPEVAELLCPKGHPFGTKRLCVAKDYLETFNRPNVTLVDVRTNPIAAITPSGLVLEDGTEHAGDVIVLATGFDALTGPLLRLNITGRGGILLEEKWKAGPRTFLGIATAGFPNLFMITGPGSPSVLANMTTAIEQHVEWVRDALVHLRDHDLDLIEASPEAEDAWVTHIDERARATLFVQTDSWYTGANIPGKPRVMLPYVGALGDYGTRCDEVAASGYAGFALGA